VGSGAGEELVLEQDLLIKGVLPPSIGHQLSQAEHGVYRQPYLAPGELRPPLLTWPREIPINGSPADPLEIVTAYGVWLARSEVPKLFINVAPGLIMARSNNLKSASVGPDKAK